MYDKIDFNVIANKKIENARKNIDLLIKRSGTSRLKISNIIGEQERRVTRAIGEKSDRNLTLPIIIKIATLYDYSLDILCGDTESFKKIFQGDKGKLIEKEIERVKNCIKPYLDNM